MPFCDSIAAAHQHRATDCKKNFWPFQGQIKALAESLQRFLSCCRRGLPHDREVSSQSRWACLLAVVIADTAAGTKLIAVHAMAEHTRKASARCDQGNDPT